MVKKVAKTAAQRAEMRRKSALICQTSIKQLDSAELSKLIVRLMQNQLASLSDEQFEANYQKALLTRAGDPSVFHESASGEKFPINLRWVDLKTRTHSEVEEMEKSPFDSDQDIVEFYQGFGKHASN